MKNYKLFLTVIIMIIFGISCKESGNGDKDFKYKIDQFADLKILRYKVPGFEELTLNQKKLIYYLNEAALCGRDIIWDQNYKHNLFIRHTLDEIVKHYIGNRKSEEFKEFMVYAKRVWFSNGIHHHYSTDKFKPGFSEEFLAELIENSPDAILPKYVEDRREWVNKITPLIFDENLDSKRVCQNPEMDLVANSANNFYENITQKEVEQYYEQIIDKNDDTPISYGLNSKITKQGDQVVEKVYSLMGMYGPAIKEIISWLEKASGVAENDLQKQIIDKLIQYYKTGDLETFDEYNVLWVKDLDSRIDFINGFIEVYGDPMGMKATWEAVVNFKNIEATKRTETLSSNAQWFEDNSPIDNRFKKEEVKGVSAKVITVSIIGGDCYPSTPIGINLPNSNWIRKEHGSKSVTIENIMAAYDEASKGSGFLEEFVSSPEEIELAKAHGFLAGNLHTDLHECLGHGSGQNLPGVEDDALKNYHSPLEESRADLFALYYMMDEKMVELGLMDTLAVAKAVYNGYIRNGLMTQLTRIKPGDNIQQAHMRNRQLISKWCYEKGKEDSVISMIKKEGKTYVVVNDHLKLRELFAELLNEVQRIKSEGDYEAGKQLVETYGVKVDQEIHAEVLERYEKLDLAPYSGFINPEYKPVYKGDEIVDVKIEYPDDYVEQMLYYSDNYSFLPDYN